MSRYIDLSHSVEAGMVTYRGLPGPVISDFLSREASRSAYGGQAEFNIGRIEMVANTGTYLDTPFHRYPDGYDLSQIELSSVANVEGIVIRSSSSKTRAIDAKALSHEDLQGKAVLVHTGWDVYWRTEKYFEGHPFLTRDAAEALVKAQVRLVGIDSFNMDDTADLSRPVHSLLLRAGIPIVEHLCNLQA